MKTLFLSIVLSLLACAGHATVVSVNASSTGTTTTTTKTSGTITVNNGTNRGYAVFDMASASIPALATINSVELVFVHTVSGSGNPDRYIYGYNGDISSLSAAALYSAAVTSNTMYTATWGNASTTKTMSTTTGAESFIQSYHTGTVSVTWVESGSGSRDYSITGGSSPYLSITYTCATPSGVSIGASSNPICSGSTETFTGNATNGSTYSWSGPNSFSSTAQNPTPFTTSTASAGTYTFTATSTCGLSASATLVLTVSATAPAAITGSNSVCENATVNLSNSVSGGTWSSSNTARATVNSSTGVVTGVANGSATISYANGCGTSTLAMTINASPNSISGVTHICNGSSSALSCSPAGGTWSSTNTSVMTISTGGSITGVSQGIVTISYTRSGCASTLTDTAIAAPAAITGTTSICNATSSALSNTSNYGTWSSTNSAIASVNTSGSVYGVAAGSATISYTTGCGSAVGQAVTIQQAPAAISGATSMCTGNTTALTETVSGGTWSTTSSSIASVNTSGTVYGVGAGSATISYSLTNACGTNVVTSPMTVTLTGQWLGGSSTSWSDAANWPCSTVPGSSTNVTIPSGTTYAPSITGSTYDVNNISVAAGVTLSIGSGAALSVHGSATNNGTVSGSGSMKMEGSSAQVIYGKGTYYNVTINNSNGVSINSGDTVRIITDLTLSSGAFTTNSGLRLISTASGSGRIAQITSGSISGNVSVEQYIGSGRRAFRFFGHPFTSAIALSTIGDDIDITGKNGSSNGFTTTNTNTASAFRYDPTYGNSAAGYDPGWKSFVNANSISDSNAFQQYQGIRLYVRGAKGEGLGWNAYTPSAATIVMAGAVNTGNQTITLHKGTSSDYNMISNPYPSPTDIGTAIATAYGAGHIAGSAFYVWNPYLGTAGAYETKVIGGAYVIGQNTAFQVRAFADGVTLSFTESNKSATAAETLLKGASDMIALGVYDANGHAWDKMQISFNDNATSNEDNRYDAIKATNPDLNFYSLAGAAKLAIDARPYSNSIIIPLGFTTSYAQQYVIKAENINLPAGATLYLHDKMNNQYVLLTAGAEYRFDISGDKSTQGEARFELTATASAAIVNNKGLEVSMTPNPATDKVTIEYTADAKANTTVKVMNIAGATVITKAIGNDANGKVTISLNELPAGVYMVEVTSGDAKKVSKLVKE